MTGDFVRKFSVFYMFLLLLALAPTAKAQQVAVLNAPSPEKIAVTPGGVDIRTGRLGYSKTDISIGEGPGAIALERMMATPILGHAQPFGNLSHNWNITLVIKSILNQEYNSYDYIAEVSYGGRSQTFEMLYGLDSSFRQKSQNDFTRLTMSGYVGGPSTTYTYRATDGTVAVFQPISGASCGTWECHFVTYVIEPDGTRFDFQYETTTAAVPNKARLRSVTSSRGYALLLEHGGGGGGWNNVSKACVINLGTITKPANNVCPGNAHATSTYAFGSVHGRTVMTSAVTPDTANETIAYTSTVPNVSFQMAHTKPGQASPWMTNAMAYSFTSDGEQEPYVASQSFPDGSSYSYSYDLTPVTDDGMGNTPFYQTISGGAYVNALNQTTEVRYDFPPMPSSMTPPRVIGGMGQGYVYVYYGDVVYQVTPGPARIVDPLGRTTTSNYCDANAAANLPPYIHQRCLVTLMQDQTSPDGQKVKLKYGVNRNPTEIRHVAKPGSGLADTVETATYDGTACLNYAPSCNKPLTVTDAKGITTTYTWSATHGQMLTEKRAAPSGGATQPEKRYSYAQFYAWYRNSAGTVVQSPYPVWLLTQISECRTGAAPTCVGTADETRTTITYPASGSANNLLPVSQTVAAGDGSLSATTSWTYDERGNKLTEDGPLAGSADTTRWRYDAMRRVIGVIMPDPDGAGPRKHRATRNTYDLAGRLVKVEQGTVNSQSDGDWAAFVPLQTMETAYDPLDRKLREWTYGPSEGVQTLTQYSYDLAGRLECTAVRMNPATFGSPPASACTLGTEGSFGPDRITKLTYDAAGQLTKTIMAFGTPLQTDEETNSYTLNGKLATVTDGENNRTTFEYDGHDRLSKTRYPVTTVGALASSTTDYEQLTYDANDNIITRRLRDGQLINYSYDALNRMTAKDVPNAVTGEYDVTTSFDLLDRPLLVNDSAGNQVGSGYDALGRLVSQSSPFGTVAMQYDLAGRLTRVTHPDGNHFAYDYDTSDLIGLRENSSFTLANFAYDDLGRRTQISRGNGTATSLTLDPVGRLRSFAQDLSGSTHDLTVTGPAAGGTGMSYSPSSQLLSQTRSNDAYAWTAHFNVNRPYGANGLNQLTSAGASALAYDGRGNLTSDGTVTYGYTAENRLTTASGGKLLLYDPTGRLTRIDASGLATRFEYLGPRLIAERDAGGAILRRYVHGPGDDEPLVWYEGSGLADRRWLHADERGSVIAVSDASGNAINLYAYDEYGVPAPGNVGRFQYTGQVWLPELSLYYYKARIYSPTLGRFLQTDPIGYKDGINWYAYVGNDPVNKVDPDGRQLVEKHKKDKEVVTKVNKMVESEKPQRIQLDKQTSLTVKRTDERVSVTIDRKERVGIFDVNVKLQGDGDLSVSPGKVTVSNITLRVVDGPATVRQSPSSLTLSNGRDGRVRVQTDRALVVKPTVGKPVSIGPINKIVNP